MICNEKGFSLLEIIAVLIIMGILTAVAVNKMDLGDSELESQIEAIKNQIRFAQAQSMGLGNIYGVSCNGGAYFVFRNGNTSNRVLLPGESSNLISLSDKDVSSMTSFTVSFDGFGAPYPCRNPSSCSALTTGLSIAVGGKSNAISITPVTGFIN